MPTLLEGDISREEHESAIGAAHSEGVAEGRREGETIGAAAAYARIGAIMRSDKIKGNEALAADLACQSPHMSVDAGGRLHRARTGSGCSVRALDPVSR